MSTSWFGIEQAMERSEPHKYFGIIGVDLSEWKNGLSAEFREEGFSWTNWLSLSMGRSDLWFGDEVANHLWLYAEIPATLGEEGSESYLRGLAKTVKEAIITQSGGIGNPSIPSSRYQERGIGYAPLRNWHTQSIKDVVYEGVLKATGQIKESLSEQEDWDLRFEFDRILSENSIRSVYQPIMRLRDGEVFGYEALTRCSENSLFEGPQSLFAFADRHNMSLALDRIAREKAIRYCPGLAINQKIFINVTMGIINDPHFVSGQTLRWLKERGLHPGQVVFELTERNSIDDFEAAKKILAHYRRQGYEIAIDDAGAGYSSLQSIVELNPDFIKLDRSLVQMADRDEMKKHMLLTIVGFAKQMNIRTVAEGIERPEELKIVQSLGFDYAQGYLLGRPSEFAVTGGAFPRV